MKADPSGAEVAAGVEGGVECSQNGGRSGERHRGPWRKRMRGTKGKHPLSAVEVRGRCAGVVEVGDWMK